MSSHAYDIGIIEPIRVSAFGTRSSIQRCFSSNG